MKKSKTPPGKLLKEIQAGRVEYWNDALEKHKPFSMTPAEYATARSAVGSQTAVAVMLGIHRVTLVRRENGDPHYPITTEAALAITALPRQPAKAAREKAAK